MATFSAVKDPDEVLDYELDWSTWLDGDTIAASTITVEAGLTKDSDSNTTARQTVWLSGGTAGSLYDVTFEIVTTGGRTAQRTLVIRVRNR